MKKLMLMSALAAFCSGALAWDVDVPKTNNMIATKIMIAPPVLATPYPGIAQLPVRSTSVVVAAGAKYRLGNQVIVAAHAGSITNTLVTTYYTNGVVVDLTGAQWAATNSQSVVTNIAVAPITVPATGLSGYDGTVRWYRARAPEQNDLRVQLVYDGDTIVFENAAGDEIRYTAAAITDYLDYQGSLFVSELAQGTNSVRVLAW